MPDFSSLFGRFEKPSYDSAIVDSTLALLLQIKQYMLLSVAVMKYAAT